MSSPARHSLEARFSEAWQQLAPAKLRAGVLIAVSGGVDSMVLAHLVYRSNIRCAIAHVNFALRGEASDGDEAFVRSWAENRNLAFHTIRFDTESEAATRSRGIQETARDLRYAWFEQVRTESDYSAVLTAHHADDNAETVLLNLFRGAGLTGLGGIPLRSGSVLRPLLRLRKSALEDFARNEAVAFREDASNATDDYLRNAIRHTALPALNALFPDAAGWLADTATRLRETAAIYEPALRHRLKTLMVVRGADTYVPIRALRKAEPLRTLAHEIFAPTGFSPAQIPHVLALMDAQTGRFVDSTTHRVVRHREHLVVTRRAFGEADMILVEGVPTSIQTSRHLFSFSETTPPDRFVDDANVAWLDCDTIESPLILRRARAGDYFYPLGMERKKKKVARFLTALKVPRHEKESAWVLESAGRIAWVAGYRIDERFKISAQTTKAIRVEKTPLEAAP